MWRVPNVIRVDSLANFNWVHAEEEDLLVEPLLPDDEELTPEFLAARKKIALAHETLPNYLVNKDATVALLFATVKPAIGGRPTMKVFNGAEGPDGKRLEGVRNPAKRFSTGDPHRPPVDRRLARASKRPQMWTSKAFYPGSLRLPSCYYLSYSDV